MIHFMDAVAVIFAIAFVMVVFVMMLSMAMDLLGVDNTEEIERAMETDEWLPFE